MEREKRRRAGRLPFALVALAIIVGAGVSTADSGVRALQQASQPDLPSVHLLAAQHSLQITRPGYHLAVDPRTGVMQVASPSGLLYTSVPLTALVGRNAFAPGTTTVLTATASGLRVDTADGAGNLLVSATVTTAPRSLTVGFKAVIGQSTGLVPQFFHDGKRGLDQSSIGAGYTPDPAQRADARYPRIDTSVRTPLSPAPLDVELRAAPGWIGFGLVQLPCASSLAIGRGGAVEVDYPLKAIAKATATPDGLVAFPDFVLTFAGSALDGLRAYHDALVSLGAAPATATAGPAWWHDPIVDTWGEQVATGRLRTSPQFTAAWVHSFAQEVRDRYGLGPATIVIDSAWQQKIGEAQPDPVRFGGWQGMRALIDSLHAQGFHVVLWWPMWAHDIRSIPARTADFVQGSGHFLDPGVNGFDASIAATVDQLLGSTGHSLGADGLKLDWAYDIPSGLSDPARSAGAAALYHYLDVIHTTAGRVHPGAIVEASAASPQFERVTDSIRLYDAWNEHDWERRAAVVAAANPGQLIDGDGWETSPANAVQHAVLSTVYGVPALYFGSHWSNGSAVDPATARLIGTVMRLSSRKREGSATRTTAGWVWQGIDGTTVQSLQGDRVLAVWQPIRCGGTGTVVVTKAGTYAVSLRLPAASSVSATSGGKPLAVSRSGDGVLLSLPAGHTAELRATC